MFLQKAVTTLRLGLLCLLALAVGSVPSPAQQEITNDSIIQMTKAGLGDPLIVQSINATPSRFSTTTDDLIALKRAGVSERVLGAMVAKNGTPPPTKSPSPTPDRRQKLDMGDAPSTPPLPAVPADFSLEGVEDTGVYYKAHDGKWVAIEPELMNFRSGGALKSYGTDHLIKEDKNGHLMGPTSPLALTRSTPILLYMPGGSSAIEYLLLRLRPGAQKSREFRSETGGVFHSSTGATRDRVVFSPTRISRQIYTFNLPDEVGKGEYGILPPNQGGNSGQAGKVYTFKIIE